MINLDCCITSLFAYGVIYSTCIQSSKAGLCGDIGCSELQFLLPISQLLQCSAPVERRCYPAMGDRCNPSRGKATDREKQPERRCLAGESRRTVHALTYKHIWSRAVSPKGVRTGSSGLPRTDYRFKCDVASAGDETRTRRTQTVGSESSAW